MLILLTKHFASDHVFLLSAFGLSELLRTSSSQLSPAQLSSTPLSSARLSQPSSPQNSPAQRSSKPKLMPEFSPLTDEGLLPYSNGPIALQYDYRVTILNSVSLSEK